MSYILSIDNRMIYIIGINQPYQGINSKLLTFNLSVVLQYYDELVIYQDILHFVLSFIDIQERIIFIGTPEYG